MISYSEALERTLREATKPLGSIDIALENALGRVASHDVHSTHPNPAFRNAAMDGFAVRTSDIDNAERNDTIRLCVIGTCLAGMSSPALRQDAHNPEQLPTAIEITTGALVPDEYNAVVRIEDTIVTRDACGEAQWIELKRSVNAGTNIRQAGEDFSVGTTLINRGTCITPQHLMLAASSGLGSLPVIRTPRISILCTGDEVIAPSTKPQQLPPGKIFGCNEIFLRSAFKSLSMQTQSYETASDNPQKLTQTFERILEGHPEVVITTGAVSMGTHDFIPKALAELSAEIIFHKVAIRPAKPMLFAKLALKNKQNVIFFCLPGNPISSVVAMRFFVLPYLMNQLGMNPEQPIKATLANDIKKPKDLRCFFFGKVDVSKDSKEVFVIQKQKSFMLTPFVESNSWVILKEGTEHLEKGELVDCLPLYPQAFNK